MQRIKSLDGIRGVSIIMVLLAHVMYSLPKELTNSYVYLLFANSQMGVMIFFVISGYLITKLLLAEREKKGAISIKDFYLRRAFRIFPVFYFYILIVIVLKIKTFPEIFSDWWTPLYAGMHLWNYEHLLPFHKLNEQNGYWFFGHFWSLSIEEQFYLIWPFVFRKFSTDALKKGIITVLLILPVVRVGTYFLAPGSRGQVDMMLHTGCGMILMGCLGALLETSGSFIERIQKLLLNKWLVGAAFAFLFVINWFLSLYLRGAYWLPVGNPLTSVTILFLLLWCIYIPSPVQTFLNSQWITQIGILSYSLYIWQQLIFSDTYHAYINTFPFNIITVFIIAIISYYAIERPFIRFKKKFERIHVRSVKEKVTVNKNAAPLHLQEDEG